jgi:hypothetical protein
MRTIAAALFLIATISAASAQSAQSSFSQDHGHAADAVAASRAAAAAAQAKAWAIANGKPLTPSQSTDFSINGRNVIRAMALTPEQEKADADGRIAWQARCKPAVVEDREGLRRTRYAEPDCDLSRFNTAGK